MIFVTIEDYELLVEIEPVVISAGEEAIITVKKQFMDGRVEEFPAEQIFDAEIVAGTEYGVLYDPNSGETGNSLQDVMNGFRIITSNSIAEDSVAIILKVRTTVDGELPTGAITNSREETERAKQESEISKQKINTELLVIGGGEIEGYGKVVVKKDGCDEEIVYAITNVPQKLSPEKSEFKLLRSDSWWYWIDNNGVPMSTQVGDPASHGVSGSGATLFLQEIEYNNNIKWNFGDDLKITAILDTILKTPYSYMWIFDVANLRIPILSDLSRWNLEGAINLGDGTDTLLLSAYITNDSIYNLTLYKLHLYTEGAYSNQFEILEGPNFVFYPGILLHEEHHFIMKKRFISQKLENNTFPLIRKLSLYNKDYTCPEQTKFQHQLIIRHLRTGILVGGDLSIAKDEEIDLTGYSVVRMKKEDGYVDKLIANSELAADKYASGFYSTVRGRIIKWWQNR